MNPCLRTCIWLIAGFCMVSCHPAKKLTDENVPAASTIEFDKINSDSVYKRIVNNQDLKFLSAKGHVSFSSKEEDVQGKINLYLIKDSLNLAIIKKLGIEIYRILITKDSFKILDRINENYLSGNLDEFIEKYNLPFEFTSIQQLFTSGCFLDPDVYYEYKKNRHGCLLTGISESQTLTYQLDTFRLLPYLFEANYEDHTLDLDVQKSHNYSGKWIPVQLVISIFNLKNPLMKIQIDWDEIKLDPITSLKFVIPPYYTKSGE